MKTVILSKFYNRDSRIIESTAKELGYETYRLVSSNLSEELKQKELLVYCEGFMAEFISQETGVVVLKPLIDSLARVPRHYVKRDITFTTKKDFTEFNKPKFVKPADHKFFEAGIYTSKSEIKGVENLNEEDPIFVSELVDFVEEYRLFCCDNKVESASIYVKDKKFVGENQSLPEVENSILDFAKEILKGCYELLPPGVVIDIGRLQNGDLALIEFNPVFSSGIYGNDPKKVLKCVAKSCIQKKAMLNKFEKFKLF